MTDKTASSQIDLNQLNEQYIPFINLLTWNYFNIPKTSSAVLTELSDTSFTLKIKEKTKTYTFPSESQGSSIDKFKEALVSHSTAKFPTAGIVSIVLWIIAIIGSLDDKYAVGPIAEIKKLLLSKLFVSSSNAYITLAVIFILHFGETLFIAYLLQPIFNKKSDLFQKINPFEIQKTWLTWGFLLGLPITEQVWLLSSLQSKAKRS